jgi:hypothetical protein
MIGMQCLNRCVADHTATIQEGHAGSAATLKLARNNSQGYS